MLRESSTGGSMSRSRGNVPFLLTIAALLLAVSSQLGHAQNASIVLQAKLAGNLNTKSAMVGDAIVAKTTNASVFKDGTDLPQGTKLIGKLVAVQSKQDGGGTSTLAIRFN